MSRTVRTTGTVTFLELALDAAGNLDRLALDFDDTCGGRVTPGSIRYRSTVPLRRGAYGAGTQPAPLFQPAKTLARAFTPLRSAAVLE
jgi:hypothetical protein